MYRILFIFSIFTRGWQLSMHLKEALLQLSTKECVNEVLLAENPESIKEIRTALRMATLFHDCGKLLDIYTPGAHENIGGNLWNNLKPNWINETTASWIRWLIITHDLFGRLARGISEKIDQSIFDDDLDVGARPSYQGALDPDEVRERLCKYLHHRVLSKCDLGVIFLSK
jgi:hypothetical protein